MILGVCSWIAERLNISPSIIRLAFVIAVFVYGVSIFAYFIGFIVKKVVS